MNEENFPRKMKFEATKIVIDIYKNASMAFVVAAFGMIGYLFVNVEKLSIAKRGFIFGAIFIVFLIIVFCARMLFKKIKEMEELK